MRPPALTIAGYWLWQERPLGYVVGGVVLVLGAMLTPSIVGMTVVLVLEGEITVSAWVIGFTLAPLVIATALAIKFLLAFDGRQPPRSTDGTKTEGTQTTDTTDA